MMKSWLRHFILGIVIGFVSILLLYVMFNSVVNGGNINVTSELIIVLAYGVGTTIIGEALMMFSRKKK
jgi:sulfite exporter TauE/SafE